MLDFWFISGVQQGSIHGESKQAQSRRAIIRMLGKNERCFGNHYSLRLLEAGFLRLIKSFTSRLVHEYVCERHKVLFLLGAII